MNDVNFEKAKKFLRKEGNEIPDIFFTSLDRILLPIACQSFEYLGIEVAGRIARKYGASITVLHNGTRNVDRYISKLDKFKLSIEKKVTENKNTAEAILEEAENDYQLVIMPSRRRAKWIDKFFINSISAKVIPIIDYDVLQVFPSKGGLPGDESTIPDFTNIGVLLSRTQRDPKLMFWTNALLGYDNPSVKVYHLADIPSITPFKGAMDTDLLIQEKQEFDDYIEGYSDVFAMDMEAKFVLTHNIAEGSSKILKKDKPDIAIMGQTKEKPWYQIRSLSDKILDWTDVPVIVHHQPI